MYLLYNNLLDINKKLLHIVKQIPHLSIIETTRNNIYQDPEFRRQNLNNLPTVPIESNV